MNRHPELAHLAGLDPDVVQLRHFAIDKVTAAHIAVGMINRAQDANDPVKELVGEEKLVRLMEDATYAFRKYLRLKMAKYEQLLQTVDKEKDKIIANQNETITRGNKLIKDTIDLAKERGLQ